MISQQVFLKQPFGQQRMKHIGQQSGFSLVEVLVTVIIIAIGSLGIAGMQIAGLKYSSGSYARTQAIILADDMVSRLKANRNHALNRQGGNFGASDYEVDNYINIADFGVGAPDCLINDCTAAEVASYDLEFWLTEISRALPFGEGSIQVNDFLNADGVLERQFVIGLQWRQVAGTNNQESNDDDEIKDFQFRISI